MGLLVVVVVVAGGMEMTVDGCACCGGATVVRARFWGLRCDHFLPRMAVKHQPCLNAHMQQRMSSKITATATDAPISR